jgi:DNA-binding NarL/FixJ family response regulator
VAQILVVDDFTPWLGVVQRILEKQIDLTIIGTVSRGVEAVQKAKELHPDLILLDINLPDINGLEATRQILTLDCPPKILILTSEPSPNLVVSAFQAGASGYVLKLDQPSDLVAGIRTVLSGQRFVSRSLRDNHNPTNE